MTPISRRKQIRDFELWLESIKELPPPSGLNWNGRAAGTIQVRGFDKMLSEMKQTESYWVEAARDDISDRICEMMQEQGVSKAELARRLGKSRQYVTRMLQGNGNFTVETLVKVAFALGYFVDGKAMFSRKEPE